MNGFFLLLGLSTKPGLPPQASRNHLVQVRMESDRGRFALTIPLWPKPPKVVGGGGLSAPLGLPQGAPSAQTDGGRVHT